MFTPVNTNAMPRPATRRNCVARALWDQMGDGKGNHPVDFFSKGAER
jgi:hypothetical protein